MENEFNPIIPPISAPTGEVAPRAPQEAVVNLRALAMWHRRMLFVWVISWFVDLASIFSYLENVETAQTSAQLLYLLVSLISWIVIIFRAISVFKVVKALQDFGPGIAAFISVWPLIGFVAIWKFNKRARRKLRAAGIRVGFWGANPKNIPA